MNKRIPVVVFTGAGASRAEPIELPTMKEFFDRIMDENRTPLSPRITDKSYFKFIFDTLYENSADYDLERVMGALYDLKSFTDNDCWKIFQHPVLFENMYSTLQSYRYVRQDLDGIYEKIKATLKTTANDTYSEYKQKAALLIRELEDLIREEYQHIGNGDIRAVYEPFFDTLRDCYSGSFMPSFHASILPFFTTNYDMSVDWFFHPITREDRTAQRKWENDSIKFIDGFDNSEWDKDTFSAIDEDSEEMLFVPYHKMHGSLLWEKSAGIIGVNRSIARDPHLNQELMLVYPSDKKLLTDEPYFYYQQMLDSYLNRADNLLVIGFSFRDPAIVQSFQYALINNEELKILVVNPEFEPDDFPELHQFITQNPDRVEHIAQFFGEKELLDILKKKIVFKARIKRGLTK